MLLEASLSLTTAVLAPFIVLATVLLMPFMDRREQLLVLGQWTSYLALVGVVLL